MGKIGIIGGSALYEIDDLEVLSTEKVDTPFGEPSAEYVTGTLSGKEVVFLPRHGRHHNLMPSEVNNRANIYGFKVLGVNRIISISAVGSLKEEICPTHMVLVDQFIDRTNRGRVMTFFGGGIVGHIPMAEPVCGDLRGAIKEANKDIGVTFHDGGTYVNMEGPAFSTKAESKLYRSWGADVIGMTNLPEARLAREAGICYSTVAMATDYDCWHESEESVTVEMIIEYLKTNVGAAKTIIKNTVEALPDEPVCGYAETLRNAIITPKDHIPSDVKEKLKPIIEGFI